MKALTEEGKNHAFSNFQKLISQELLNLLASSGERERTYTPLVVLQAMLFQALDGASSCRKAVCFIQEKLKKKLRLEAAAFCRARAKLALPCLEQMVKEAGAKLSKSGRRKFIWIDGFIVNTQDSLELRAKFPHTRSQKQGLGQPIIRILGAFCAKSGALLDYQLGKFVGKGQGEPSLLKLMIERFEKGSVLVMDRFFTNAILLELICQLQLHFVVRGRAPQLENLFKRNQTQVLVPLSACYQKNKKISNRIITVARVKVGQKGFRPKWIYVMSSLVKLSGQKLCAIYRQRWNVEVAIRHIKQSLGLELIAAKSEAVALRILAVTLLAYNLAISVVASAKIISSKKGQVSFKMATFLLLQKMLRITARAYHLMLTSLCQIKFSSPYRREPRAVKRRANKYPHLTVRREQSIEQVWGYGRREGKGGLYA